MFTFLRPITKVLVPGNIDKIRTITALGEEATVKPVNRHNMLYIEIIELPRSLDYSPPPQKRKRENLPP